MFPTFDCAGQHGELPAVGCGAAGPGAEEITDEARCVEAVAALAPAGVSPTNTLKKGALAHVPPGCSVRSGGGWGAAFNTQRMQIAEQGASYTHGEDVEIDTRVSRSIPTDPTPSNAKRQPGLARTEIPITKTNLVCIGHAHIML